MQQPQLRPPPEHFGLADPDLRALALPNPAPMTDGVEKGLDGGKGIGKSKGKDRGKGKGAGGG